MSRTFAGNRRPRQRRGSPPRLAVATCICSNIARSQLPRVEKARWRHATCKPFRLRRLSRQKTDPQTGKSGCRSRLFVLCELNMANAEHVEIVKKGDAAVAAWRRDNELVQLDLRDARLEAAYLVKAHLVGANLTGASLQGAHLSDADLAAAGYTLFADLDLADVCGLESMHHTQPSTIGVDTLFKSRGKIPETFLRGCGVPEELIVQLPAIIGSMEPIQFYSCFISYCSDDDAFARRLYARLAAENLRVWFTPEDMRGGKKTLAQIDEAIRVYDRLLLVLSRQSMASEWVRLEIKRAQRKEQETGTDVLFPIALVPHDEIRAWEWIDSDTGEDLARPGLIGLPVKPLLETVQMRVRDHRPASASVRPQSRGRSQRRIRSVKPHRERFSCRIASMKRHGLSLNAVFEA